MAGGRARTIKPGILEDEKTAQLEDREWRVFVSLWLIADDYGNLRGDPGLIRAQILWAQQSVTSEVISAVIDRLVELGLVARYVVRGQSYIAITGWKKHQKIDHPSRRQIPGPDPADVPVASTSEESREALARPSRKTREKLPKRSRKPREPLGNDLDRIGEERREFAEREHRPSAELSPGWVPDPDLPELARSRGLDPDDELEKFSAWAESSGAKSRNWNAAFRKWILDARTPEPESSTPAIAAPVVQVEPVLSWVVGRDGSPRLLRCFPDGNRERVSADEEAKLGASGAVPPPTSAPTRAPEKQDGTLTPANATPRKEAV